MIYDAASRRHAVINLFQSMVLIATMAALLGFLGWFLGGTTGLIFTVAASIAVLLFAPKVSHRLLLRMYHARQLGPRSAPQLVALAAELARRADLPAVPTLYYLPSAVMNAFTTGSRDDAAIAFSDGMLRNLDSAELAAVMAHEISHVANNDMWVMSVADLVSRVTSVLSLVGQGLLLFSIPALLTGGGHLSLIPALVLIFAPTLAAVLQMGLSRTREYEADRGAAELLGNPAPLASALGKLGRYQGGLMERILLPGRKVPDPSLLRSHPPTAERIERLEALSVKPFPALQQTARRLLPADILANTPRPPRWRVSGLWY